jgi:hypothetical protein
VRTVHPRTVEVGSGRLERWITGFGERHPGASVRFAPDEVELSAPDGSHAVLHPPFPPMTAGLPIGGDGAELLSEGGAARVANARGVAVLRVLMIRRGGYACAVVTGHHVTASKVGSRYVQGRTAAGGWSQQRFARRREGQTQALLGSALEVAARVLLPCSPDDALVTGGDRPLLDRLLTDARLKPLTALRAGPHLEIGDPKSDLVKDLPERARAVRIRLDER